MGGLEDTDTATLISIPSRDVIAHADAKMSADALPLLPPARPIVTARGRSFDDIPPVTGAWRPEKRVGNRQFVTLFDDEPLVLEGGGVLAGVEVAYETWGTLDGRGSNAVVVNHALTGDGHVMGPPSDRIDG